MARCAGGREKYRMDAPPAALKKAHENFATATKESSSNTSNQRKKNQKSIENTTYALQVNATTGNRLTVTFPDAHFVTFKIQGNGPVTAPGTVQNLGPRAIDGAISQPCMGGVTIFGAIHSRIA
jgi:hypothetical protein